jgi:Flp pilus assembly pilin Flp
VKPEDERGKSVIQRYSSLLARLGEARGQTYVEYALILVAITSIVLAGWANLDGAMNGALSNVISAL